MKARFRLVLTMSLLAAAPAHGQNLDERQFTIHPQPIDAEPLRYRLLPDAADQVPGNAATLYLATFHWAGPLNADETFQKVMDLPDHRLALGEDGARVADAHQMVMRDLLLAGRRTWCVWDTSFRDQGISSLLPWLNDARTLANFVSVDARVRIGRGQYERAIMSLRAGFALADNLDRDPVAVQGLIAVGIQDLMLWDAALLVQQPGAPNLYWPLAIIPPLDRERGRILENETASLFFTLPQLKDATQLSAEKTRSLVHDLQTLVERSRADQQLVTLAAMIRAYPAAKRYLRDAGISQARIDAIPANSAVLAYWVADYRRHADAARKWAGLPMWQGDVRLQKTEAALGGKARDLNPLLEVLRFTHRLDLKFGLVERERTMLQTVEAIRAYAAAHQRRVPQSLDELSPDTPAPLDPLRGKPYEYEGSAGAATLRAPDLPGHPLNKETIYRITIAR